MHTNVTSVLDSLESVQLTPAPTIRWTSLSSSPPTSYFSPRLDGGGLSEYWSHYLVNRLEGVMSQPIHDTGRSPVSPVIFPWWDIVTRSNILRMCLYCRVECTVSLSACTGTTKARNRFGSVGSKSLTGFSQLAAGLAS
jgi:hypothetical protein